MHSVHAPTEDKNKKYDFYEKLMRIYERIRKDIIKIMIFQCSP